VLRWKRAYTIHLFDKTQALAEYKILLQSLDYNGEFLFNYGALLVEAGRPADGIETLNKAKYLFNHIDLHLYLGNAYQAIKKFDAAEKCYGHASQMIPSRFYPKYFQALLYKEREDMIMAKRVAKEIIDMDIKVPSPVVEGIRDEMKDLLNE
jgi:tetratricopeptide (TPR) repeat protein